MSEGPDAAIGALVAGRYRVEALIARGGMARVYRARDTRLERDVAVKVLSSPYRDDPDFVARFLAEARAAGSLSHPSLVHVYDSGSDDGTHFIVMELLDRHRSLRQELDARGVLRSEEVIRIGRELLAGLRVVHERGLVHCDVKPANVMLGPGAAKLIDFGIARIPNVPLEGDRSIGSLHVMSPEQLHGEPMTPASDLFSLGVVLYEALTGRVPYRGSTPEEITASQAAGRVQPPSTIVPGVPADLDVAVLQALRPDPRQRFASAAEMDAALANAAGDLAAARNDETAVHRSVRSAPPPPKPAWTGYQPPPPEPERFSPRPAPPPAPPPARRRAARRGTPLSAILGMLGTVAILAAAALVVVFVIIPLLRLGEGSGGGAGGGSAPATVPAEGTPAPGHVFVPDTIGMATEDAVEAAREAGLDWTVRCDQDESQPEGVIDQEPAAGAEVRVGSPFSMYSARIEDCEREY